MRYRHPIRKAALLVALLAPVAAFAQFKCVQADGKISFQQMPCEGGGSSQRLGVDGRGQTPPPAAGGNHWAAIARGVPEVGMTRKELDSAVGRPDKSTVGQNGGDSEDVLTYNKADKTYDVSLRNGVVTSVYARDPDTAQATTAAASAPKRACMSPAAIRDLEFEASKIQNRNNLALRHMINDQKACR